ncbi:MAG: acyl--CoA ligase [Ruminococcaceae bacterium]|nr:acyl--CoA ligase [Oscillospiraceae bacterium]
MAIKMTPADYGPHIEQYLRAPETQSCYEYLHECYNRIRKDLGDDYIAFMIPVADQESAVRMPRLLADIEKLASYFASIGLKKGDVYTVFLPTCGHAVVAMYALNKLGIIANYVHPMTPPNALAEIMSHTKSKGIFTLDILAGPFAPLLKNYPTVVGSVSDFCDGVALQYALYNEKQNAKVPELDTITIYKDILKMDLPEAELVKDMGKQDAFYMHGGGTTGRSKTIRLSSYAFNSLAYKFYLLDLPHDYKTAHAISAIPCFHAYGLAGVIHYGICNAYKPFLCAKFDARQTNDIIRKYNVIEFIGVPKMFQKMMQEDNFENEGTKNLAMVFAGSDIVSKAFVDEFDAIMEKHGASARMCRGYGLTEVCGVVTSNGGAGPYRKDSTGFPLYGLTIEIWDDECNKLPVGEVGEICVTGDSIMNGYLPDSVINESGIYTDENGVNWIRTGDMGYLDEDGFMYFAGRKKRIIIISGYNIYPATIEEKVDTLPYINEVCAVQGYSEDGKPLVKLVVSLLDKEADHEKVIADLKAFCEANLESISVPRKYEIMDLLPRTKMEKIDFMKLSDPVPQ